MTQAGAQTATPGPYALHALGALVDPAPVDLGQSIGTWTEGATPVPDALTPGVRDRVQEIADAVDPDGRVRRSRFVL